MKIYLKTNCLWDVFLEPFYKKISAKIKDLTSTLKTVINDGINKVKLITNYFLILEKKIFPKKIWLENAMHKLSIFKTVKFLRGQLVYQPFFGIVMKKVHIPRLIV